VAVPTRGYGTGCVITVTAHPKPPSVTHDSETLNERLLLACVAEVAANPDAKRLYTDLLVNSGYNKLIRPVGNNSDKLTVKLGLRLSQLIDVVRAASLCCCIV